MVSALLVQPEVRRACMVGVGGAQLSVQPRGDFDLLGLARRCTTEPDWGDALALADDFEHERLDEVAEQSNRSCAPTCEGDE